MNDIDKFAINILRRLHGDEEGLLVYGFDDLEEIEYFHSMFYTVSIKKNPHSFLAYGMIAVHQELTGCLIQSLHPLNQSHLFFLPPQR